MVRLVAAVSALVGIAAMAAFLQVVGKGPWAGLEARHLREMKDRDESPVTVETVTPPDLYALPRHLSVAEYSGIERRAVALECRVRHMQRASDGDLHLECRAPDSTDARYVTAEITPVWRGRPAPAGFDVPGWGYDQLAATFRPRVHYPAPWPGTPARLRITGWLLYDEGGDVIERFFHLPRKPRPTDWEIHPVTKIERWDDRLASWVEVRR